MHLTSVVAVVVLAGWTTVWAGYFYVQDRPTAIVQRPNADIRPTTRAFIEDLALASLADVKLGEMAADKATNPDIKNFGQLLIVDHLRALSELAQAAASLGVSPPSELDPGHRAIGRRLAELDGMDFDREYIGAMLEGHADSVGRLRARVSSLNDSTQGSDTGRTDVVGTSESAAEQAVGQWALKTLPTEERHLERARDLQRRVR